MFLTCWLIFELVFLLNELFGYHREDVVDLAEEIILQRIKRVISGEVQKEKEM